MNFDFAFKIVASIASLMVIINYLAKGYLTINKWRKDKLSGKGKFYGGNWNNQGQIKNRPTHYIDIDGWGDGKKFEGRFNVRNSDDPDSWEMFKISSRRSFNKLFCDIFRIEDGVQTLVAKGTLKKEQRDLRWTLRKSDSDQFPKEALLRRGLPKVA